MSDNNKNSDQLHIKRFSNLVQDHQHLDSYVKYCTQQLEEEIPFFICIFQTKQNSTETTRRYLLHTQTKG